MHPILYSKKLSKIIPEDFEEPINQMWKDQKPYLKWTNQYNTKLEDNYNKLDPLWKEFCNIPEKIISPKTYYVYINDKNWHKTHWHDHSKTASIVAVYYLSKNNSIEFIDKNDKIVTYNPKQYEMIYFLGNTKHRPVPNSDYRFSINVEGYHK